MLPSATELNLPTLDFDDATLHEVVAALLQPETALALIREAAHIYRDSWEQAQIETRQVMELPLLAGDMSVDNAGDLATAAALVRWAILTRGWMIAPWLHLLQGWLFTSLYE